MFYFDIKQHFCLGFCFKVMSEYALIIPASSGPTRCPFSHTLTQMLEALLFPY